MPNLDEQRREKASEEAIKSLAMTNENILNEIFYHSDPYYSKSQHKTTAYFSSLLIKLSKQTEESTQKLIELAQKTESYTKKLIFLTAWIIVLTVVLTVVSIYTITPFFKRVEPHYYKYYPSSEHYIEKHNCIRARSPIEISDSIHDSILNLKNN